MRNFIFFLSVALLGSTLTFSDGTGRPRSPGSQTAILNRVVAMGNSSASAPSVFQGAALLAGVPGGTAFLEGCANQPPLKVRPRGNTFGAVLSSITHGDPSYIWRVRAGVVNLMPSSGVPALLKTRLAGYDSMTATDAASAITLLSSSPQVVGAARKLGLAHDVSGSALSGVASKFGHRKKPLGVHLINVSLLRALNAIARANRHGVWMYRETHCDSVRQYDITFVQ